MNAQDRASRACNDAHERHELKVELEQRRKAENAPDREKLLAFAQQIKGTCFPLMATKEGDDIIAKAAKMISAAVHYMTRKAGEL